MIFAKDSCLRPTELIVMTLCGSLGMSLAAQTMPDSSTISSPGGWDRCTQTEAAQRLACFDAWVLDQKRPIQLEIKPLSAINSEAKPVTQTASTPDNNNDPDTTLADGCRNRHFSALSRFWELEKGSDCHTFGIRGYRPISLSWIAADSTNSAPSSPAVGHTASAQHYQRFETRIQLSVRTKIAQGLLTPKSSESRDSLWFGYTQQSYWQLFNGALSRPFRNTDHEPEVMYVYPTQATLPGGWQLRYSGLGLAHQSNGQSLPLSRSWNRVYLMAGAELGERYRVMGRAWQRLTEKVGDDNPDITEKLGRVELQGMWDVDNRNTIGATLRNSMAAKANGSMRLDWYRTLGIPDSSSLRLHAQLFSGYGDSLVDYNRRRVVFSLGLSLVDF
ncbi:MAG: phospholipase A [Hylemonella sp.]|nr:phospholipase A [Hylemonella sp.]